MEIEFKNKKEAEIGTSITDYPVGTIVKYTTGDNESFIGIILEASDDEYVLYDIEDDHIYDDIENYIVIKVLEGHFVLED